MKRWLNFEDYTAQYTHYKDGIACYFSGFFTTNIKLGKKSVQGYKSSFRHFITFCVEHNYIKYPPAKFDEAIARHFFTYINRYLDTPTANTTMVRMGSFFSYLNQEKRTSSNPFRAVKRHKRRTTSPYACYTSSQMDRMREYTALNCPQLWAFIEFMSYTLARPGEIRLLKIENLYPDLDDRKVLFLREVSKSNRQEYIPMCDALFELIEREEWLKYPSHYYIFGKNGIPSDEAMGVNYMSSLHRSMLKALRINTKTHKLYSHKHSAAVRAYLAGVGILELCRLLRHRDLSVTYLYLSALGCITFKDIKAIPKI